jgi:hypothetical protein
LKNVRCVMIVPTTGAKTFVHDGLVEFARTQRLCDLAAGSPLKSASLAAWERRRASPGGPPKATGFPAESPATPQAQIPFPSNVGQGPAPRHRDAITDRVSRSRIACVGVGGGSRITDRAGADG